MYDRQFVAPSLDFRHLAAQQTPACSSFPFPFFFSLFFFEPSESCVPRALTGAAGRGRCEASRAGDEHANSSGVRE